MKIRQNPLSPSLRRVRYTVVVVGIALSIASCQSDNTTAPKAPSDMAPAVEQSTIESSTTPSIAVAPIENAQVIFWEALKTLCHGRFRGQLTIGTEESDRDFGLADLTMKARQCQPDAIDIGFKADEDDSRTWMFRRVDGAISLHHRHLDKSGQPDATSGYGGTTANQGNPIRQEFPADKNTGSLIPAAATNVWAIEIMPGESFAYELQRIEEQRMFRVVFDLTNPLP
ncbi:MAG: hypothetical protein AAF465_05450 [Pseudomonadota bacterium]